MYRLFSQPPQILDNNLNTDFMATAISESIFDIFRKYKVPVNGTLYPRHIVASTHLWDKQRQERFEQQASELVKDGYIVKEGDAYRLTQKGYNYIYQYYSLQDTVELILSDFRKRRIGENEMLLLPALLSTLQEADRYHFDNYDKAMKVLSERGWVATNGRGFVLTREGFSEVYPE